MTDNKLTTIYVVRHGEAEHNIIVEQNKEYDPSLDIHAKLTEKGENQAHELSKKLKEIHFDAVFSSDMARAKRTAEIIALEKQIAVQTSEIIRERNFGSFAGKWHLVRDGLKEELGKLDDNGKMQHKFHDVESQEDAANRLITFVREIAIAYSGKTVLIVCHGAIMRTFLIKLGYVKYNEIHPASIENTGYFVLESDGIDFFVKETNGISTKQIN